MNKNMFEQTEKRTSNKLTESVSVIGCLIKRVLSQKGAKIQGFSLRLFWVMTHLFVKQRNVFFLTPDTMTCHID